MRTLWQVEQSEFCRRVLAKHFPNAHRFNDVRDVTGCPQRWADEGGTLLEYVDVLCGGFPCQDISKVGRRAGIDGASSGLWAEYARLVGELRPRYVVVENVADLLVRGLDRVVGDLAALGYDAEWDCIPARAFGAPHLRDRLWLVAYPQQPRLEGRGERPLRARAATGGREGSDDQGRPLDDALRGRHGSPQAQVRPGRDGLIDTSWWFAEPDVGRVADGVPDRVERLRALGNALVPQIAEWIGRRIVQYEEGGIAA